MPLTKTQISEMPRVSNWPVKSYKQTPSLRSKVNERKNKLTAFVLRKHKPEFVDYEESKWPSLTKACKPKASNSKLRPKNSIAVDIAAKKRLNNPFELIAPKEFSESKKGSSRKRVSQAPATYHPDAKLAANIAYKAPAASKPTVLPVRTKAAVKPTCKEKSDKAKRTVQKVSEKKEKTKITSKLSDLVKKFGKKILKAASSSASSPQPISQKGRVTHHDDILAAKQCERDIICLSHGTKLPCVYSADHALSAYVYHVCGSEKCPFARKIKLCEKHQAQYLQNEVRKDSSSKYCCCCGQKLDFGASKVSNARQRVAKPPAGKPNSHASISKTTKDATPSNPSSMGVVAPSSVDVEARAAAFAALGALHSSVKGHVPHKPTKQQREKPQIESFACSRRPELRAKETSALTSDPFSEFGPCVSPIAYDKDSRHHTRKPSLTKTSTGWSDGIYDPALLECPWASLRPDASLALATKLSDPSSSMVTKSLSTSSDLYSGVSYTVSTDLSPASSTPACFPSSGWDFSDPRSLVLNPWEQETSSEVYGHATRSLSFVASGSPSSSLSPIPVRNFQRSSTKGEKGSTSSDTKTPQTAKYCSYRTDECVEGLLGLADDVVNEATQEFFDQDTAPFIKSCTEPETFTKDVPQTGGKDTIEPQIVRAVSSAAKTTSPIATEIPEAKSSGQVKARKVSLSLNKVKTWTSTLSFSKSFKKAAKDDSEAQLPAPLRANKVSLLYLKNLEKTQKTKPKKAAIVVNSERVQVKRKIKDLDAFFEENGFPAPEVEQTEEY